MKKITRIFSGFCAAALMTSSLAGCQTKNASSDVKTSGKEIPTLTVWTIGNQPKNLDEGLAAMNDYTAKKIGVKINLKVAGWGDWETKMNQIINTSEYFDFMFSDNTKYAQQVSQGALAEITDEDLKAVPGLTKLIPEDVWSGAKIKGKLYAIPAYKDSAQTEYWIWDEAIVKKYHIDTKNAVTLKQLDPILREIKKGEGAKNKNFYPFIVDFDGVKGMLMNYDDMTLGLPTIGVRVDDPERKVVSVLEQPEVMEDLSILHSWMEDGIMNKDAAICTELPRYRTVFSTQAYPGLEKSFAINMDIPDGNTVMEKMAGPVYTNSTIQGSLQVISKQSKYKAECLKYLELLNTDRTLRDMWSYGKEGVNFNYVDKEKGVVKRVIGMDWGLPGYAQGTSATRSVDEGVPTDQWEQIKKLNEAAEKSVILGFTFDREPVRNEVQNVRAVWDKYKNNVKTGAKDPHEIVPQVIQEMKAAGMDKIIAEAQKQIDEQFKK